MENESGKKTRHPKGEELTVQRTSYTSLQAKSGFPGLEVSKVKGKKEGDGGDKSGDIATKIAKPYKKLKLKDDRDSEDVK